MYAEEAAHGSGGMQSQARRETTWKGSFYQRMYVEGEIQPADGEQRRQVAARAPANCLVNLIQV